MRERKTEIEIDFFFGFCMCFCDFFFQIDLCVQVYLCAMQNFDFYVCIFVCDSIKKEKREKRIALAIVWLANNILAVSNFNRFL